MTEVVSVKFKNNGKNYFFAPNSLKINTGERVIVETSKGLEIAECARGNHSVEDTAVVQPLRPVVRIATKDDLRVEQINRQREKEAFQIAEQKIAEHGLDMKLVNVECNFEGNKTTFFFTSDGRVDFRELVKDLAGIFRNRIELRQIGVRDEAKMLGGIGICGRPYCCHQFLEDFQPVSTKMAKVQSLSLNPTKISGSCGRLMCCLRYEQEAYEDLVKKVPKQGAFVETMDGYGTAVQVNLLRQTVKVKLDSDTDDSLHLYKANELAAVPGGRPRDGETPPHVFEYVPPEEEIEEETGDAWSVPEMVAETADEAAPESVKVEVERKPRPDRSHRGKQHRDRRSEPEKKAEKPAEADGGKDAGTVVKPHRSHNRRGGHGGENKSAPAEKKAAPEAKKQENGEAPAEPKKKNYNHRRYYHGNKGGNKKENS